MTRTKDTRVVAIDPGLRGGYVEGVVHAYESPPTINRVCRLPHSTIARKKVLNITRIGNLLETFHPDVIIIERQFSRPGFSNVAGDTTMLNYGKLLATCELRSSAVIQTVFPITWQSQLIPNTKKGESKLASAAYCAENFPQIDCTIGSKSDTIHDGITDALCIFDYYRLNT